MGLKLLIILCCVCVVQSVIINSVHIRDNVVPVKGSSIQLVCSITGFNSSTIVEWIVTDTQDFGTGPGPAASAQCIPNNCFVRDKKHTYTADVSHMYVNITGLSQSNDRNWWTCKYADSSKELELVIYTVPTSIEYERVPDGPQDLSVNAVTLDCITNCVYPEPTFIWFYVNMGKASQYQNTSSGVTSNSISSRCTSPERDYKSTLTLARNTAFTDNSDITVRFRCGITSFPGLLTELYTPVSPNITFAVPATTPTLVNKTISGRLIVLSGDETILVCITSATRPAAIVTWTKGETNLDNVKNTYTITANNLTTVTSIVTFTPDKKDNKKVMSCMTHINGQTDSPEVKHGLHVCWGPTNATIEPSAPFPWHENQTDKYLLCKANNGDDGNPVPIATWTNRYGTPDTTNRRLIFPVLSSIHDKMTVKCELSNVYTRLKGVQIKSQTIKLDVQYNPILSIKINNTLKHSVTVIEGQSLNITCLAEGNPTPIVQWFGRPTINGQLQFVDIDRDNDNTYTCKASATLKGHVFAREQSISVIVNYAPDVSIKAISMDLTENSTVKLVCIAIGRPANYKFTAIKQTWMNTNIPYSHLDITNDTVSSIEITSLQFEDSGNYTCQVNNGIVDRKGVLNQAATMYIKVKVPPKILSKRLLFAGNVSKPVNISIPLYSYPVLDTITFTKLSEDKSQKEKTMSVSIQTALVQTKFYGMDVTLDGNIAICTIEQLNDKDFTWYRLTIKNRIGISSSTVMTFAVGPPAPPESFTIEYIGQTYAVLSWKRGFYGGFNQTFIIQIRTGMKLWHDYLSMFGGEDVSEDQINATVDNLIADNTYYIRLYSNNILGNSVFTEVLNFTTSEETKDSSGLLTGGIIGGIIGGISILCITLVLTIFMLRRRQWISEGCSCRNCDNETNNDAHANYSPTSAEETVHYENVTMDRTPESLYEALNSETPTGKIYLEINQEHDGQPNNGDINTYVNLQLNVT